MCPFFIKSIYELCFHGNQKGDKVAILPLKTFIDFSNCKYDYWILHKKLVWVEISICHKFTHISLNIGPRIQNLHTLEHPFP